MSAAIKSILERIRETRSFKCFSVGKCKLTVRYVADNKVFWLEGVRLESKYRGTGEAIRALASLMEALDIMQEKIKLHVQPMDKKTTSEGLMHLYSKFGFKKIKSESGYLTMERKPKKAVAMSIQSLSRKLAVAGVKHVVVSAQRVTATNEEDEQHFKTIISHAKEIESIEVTRVNDKMTLIVHMKSGVKHSTPFGNIFLLRKALADKHMKGVKIDWEGLYRKAAAMSEQAARLVVADTQASELETQLVQNLQVYKRLFDKNPWTSYSTTRFLTAVAKVTPGYTAGDYKALVKIADKFSDAMIYDRNKLFDHEFEKTHGRKAAPGDFRISGVGDDKLPDSVKDMLREKSHLSSLYKDLALCFQQLSRKRSILANTAYLQA